MKDKDAKIKKAILDHEFWLSQWKKEQCAFSVVMVSPRGKAMNHSSYCFEVKKHMDRTVAKIRTAIKAEPESDA